MKYENIKVLLDGNEVEKVIEILTDVINYNPVDAEAFFLRGKAYWRMGLRSKAISDYASAEALDHSSPAALALEQAREIEDFFNPDLLNP